MASLFAKTLQLHLPDGKVLRNQTQKLIKGFYVMDDSQYDFIWGQNPKIVNHTIIIGKDNELKPKLDLDLNEEVKQHYEGLEVTGGGLDNYTRIIGWRSTYDGKVIKNSNQLR